MIKSEVCETCQFQYGCVDKDICEYLKNDIEEINMIEERLKVGL